MSIYYLQPGDEIRPGDEFEQEDRSWKTVTELDRGERWNPAIYKRARRRAQPNRLDKGYPGLEIAVKVLLNALRNDPDYAWSWHCNIAMAAQDIGVPRGIANHAAAEFMRRLANVEPAHELPAKESWFHVKEQLEAAEQHVKILQEQVAEGKRQWDHVARLLGADGDDVDAVFKAARDLQGKLGTALVALQKIASLSERKL